MKLISCQNGRILTSLKSEAQMIAPEKVVATGFHALDRIAPEGGWALGSIHEFLCASDHDTSGASSFNPRACSRSGPGATTRLAGYTNRRIALLLAQSPDISGAIVWSDPDRDLYPPAIASAGIPLDRLYLLRPDKREDAIWAITECLRCPGVGITIAAVDRLSRIEARRLQLAAEHGGGIGLLFRSMISIRGQWQAPPVYAAATRWRIDPMPGERTVQRWRMQLIHGHGGRIGNTVILEHHHETNRMRAVENWADRPAETIARTG